MAERVPARVLWCNFELARQLGFSVPADNRLDRRLEKQLVHAFSLRALEPGRGAAEGATVTLHADRYFGSGMLDHLGSGRGGVDLDSEVFIKGLGRTPLAGAGNPRHTNGDCHLLQCVSEALFGELDTHLFSAGATRVVAILDQGRTVLIERKRRHAGIVARAGVPFRPAHLVRDVGADLSDLPAELVRLAELGGYLVAREGRPDLAATMRGLLRLHARTAAEQVRWRVLHGGISTSNIGLFGEMIDLNTQSTQARTAPLSVQRARRTRDGSFLGEHLSRGRELQLLYLSVIESLSPERRVELGATGLDCEAELASLYEEALDVELLRASGLDAPTADAVKREQPDLVRRYGAVLRGLMALRNPGSTNARVTSGENIGVVDVFRVLALLPRFFFAAPQADHATTMRRLARVVISGSPARRARIRKTLNELLEMLAGMYRALMSEVRAQRRMHDESWASVKAWMIQRAELENRPTPDLYRRRFLSQVEAVETVDMRSRNRLVRTLQRFLDVRIARNMRRVDAMLTQPVTHDEHGHATQRRMVDGVEHALRSRDGATWRLEVRIARPVLPRFFHFTFDGLTWRAARVRASNGRGVAVIRPPVRFGMLEGGFSSTPEKPSSCEKVLPFVFAVPAAPRAPR